ncbi:metallophosphoesterase [Aristophania vespae]|uniref:metallophosphoesterase n=1 Tax=Aristophania vespae TaxID=2697033 RepID=UPI001F402A96|nr:metallophosphoesterase [Aristophania vespae]
MKGHLIFTVPTLSAAILNRIKKFGVRVVGDVHGDSNAFKHALATERYIIQLGDLTDYGPDNVGVLKQILQLLKTERGMFVLGNHDRKLARSLAGRQVRPDKALEKTLEEIFALGSQEFPYQIHNAIEQAPAWQRINQTFFIHGGFHSFMLTNPPPKTGINKISAALARALFGEVTNKIQPDGYPERLLNWVDRIPEDITVYVGHDRRSTDGRPWVKEGRLGGKAIFMDLGAGKDGHLAWVDLDEL